MALVWGGLGDGIDIEPTELRLLSIRLELYAVETICTLQN
jgi:hypothetical protein